jgi:hypothetical protein
VAYFPTRTNALKASTRFDWTFSLQVVKLWSFAELVLGLAWLLGFVSMLYFSAC